MRDRTRTGDTSLARKNGNMAAQVVLVTGGGSGSVAASAFTAKGAAVVLAGRRTDAPGCDGSPDRSCGRRVLCGGHRRYKRGRHRAAVGIRAQPLRPARCRLQQRKHSRHGTDRRSNGGPSRRPDRRKPSGRAAPHQAWGGFDASAQAERQPESGNRQHLVLRGAERHPGHLGLRRQRKAHSAP